MKTEYTKRHKSLEDYSDWLGSFLGIGDTVECVDGEEYDEDWETDEVIVVKGYGGNILSIYNKDKEIEIMY